ncbi:MAG: DUF1836 domain-containing protein [Intestinibacillus sp.]
MPEYIPGTTLSYPAGAENAFDVILPLVAATGGLSLSQICSITGLEGSTIQNWVKRRWVSKPIDKKYGTTHLPRILLISALRDNLQIEQIVQLIAFVTQSGSAGQTDALFEEITLYDCLCATVRGLSEPDAELLQVRVRALARARCSDGDLQRRLEQALFPMSLLYLAGTIRHHALDLLHQFLI